MQTRHPTVTHRHAAGARIAAGLSALLLLAAGCQSQSGLAPGLSGMRTEMTVQRTWPLGPYRAARLDMNGKELDAYAMPTDACDAVFTEGGTVTYVDDGPLGVFRSGDLECQSFGVGNLVVWRDRSRHSTRGIVPRAQAAYRVMHRDDTWALLRGRFPGAGYLGFTGRSDLVAVIPVTGECAGLLDRRAATIEYRPEGERVLSLVGSSGLCDIRGLAKPPPQVAPGADADTE
jgi:hypothetical protein